MPIKLILAADINGAIGVGGKLPWHIPEDMKLFKEKTMGSIVVMGRKTWESLPVAYRPLPGRTNCIASRTRGFNPGVEGVGVNNDVDKMLHELELFDTDVWVIGGAEIYNIAVKYAKEIHLTLVKTDLVANGIKPDAYFNILDHLEDFELVEERNPMLVADLAYSFQVYKRVETKNKCGKQQLIVSAACVDTATGHMLVGARHFDMVMRKQWEMYPKGTLFDQQGFIDNRGKFLTRGEAWVVAEAASQIRYICGSEHRKELFSENLY